MVSVGISKLGYTDLNFVDPGVKINSTYYRYILLSQQLLLVMRDVSGEFFIFQLDNAPAHRARDCTTSGAVNAGFHSTGPLATEQPGPQSGRLQNMECPPAASRPISVAGA